MKRARLPARFAGAENPAADRGPYLIELLRLAAEGLFPSEARLEQMLDRIERLP